jgi:hypothetical protein
MKIIIVLSGAFVFGGMVLSLGHYAHPNLVKRVSKIWPYVMSVVGCILLHYATQNSGFNAILSTAILCAVNLLFHLADWIATKNNWERF